MVRRLIETDEVPIGRVSEHSRKDQNVRKGHLHTLHVWWATRPLAACRAVLMATLLPDPADENCPEEFRREAREALKPFTGRDLSDPLALRRALLNFIADFAAWENATHRTFVETARKLVAAAHPEGPPLVVDPFAGIGSIPFEALRLGADAFAGDLNPVAVLLNKVALEYLPTYGLRLAEAVRQWGQWVRERAIQELRLFYPLEPDGAEPLAYLWARTIRCEGPGCGAAVVFEIFQPRSESEVQPPIVKRFSATCPVCGYTTPYARVREQIRARRGGTQDARLIAVITLKPGGTGVSPVRGFRLAAEQDVAVARQAAEELARREREHTGPLPLVPDEPLPPEGSLGFRVNLWGMATWGDLFTPRQALALSTFVRLVREAYEQVREETGDPGFARAVATCLAVAVSNLVPMLNADAYYGQDHMRTVFQGSGLPMRPDFAEADPLMPKLVGGFDYALEQVAQVLEREGGQGFRPGTVRQGSATALPLPDGFAPYVVTDPPYYDAVPYASSSDFCYVWLRRMLYDLHPDLFRTPLTPKAEECIMDPGPPPPGEPEKTKEFFETTMKRALAECRRVLRPDGLAVVLFAHKGTAGWEAMLNALVRAGWTVTASWPIETERGARMRAKDSAVLASSVFLVCRPRPENAGVGDWRRVLEEMNRKVAEWLPRLEKEGIHGADAIFACLGPALEVYSRYDRVETAGGEVIPLGDVRTGGTRTGGTPVPLGYLSYVWEAVAREALKDFPTDEPDARVTGFWLWTLRGRINGASGAGVTPAPLANEDMLEEEEAEGAGRGTGPRAPTGYALPYDDARLILQALGAHEDQLRRPGGILEVQGNSARLVPVAERRRFLLGQAVGGALAPTVEAPRRRRRGQPGLFEEPATEPEPEVALAPGASTLDRLHQAMLLFADGRSEALRRFLVDEGVGRDAQFWRLADALSRLYPMHSQEKRWIDGLLARKKGLGL